MNAEEIIERNSDFLYSLGRIFITETEIHTLLNAVLSAVAGELNIARGMVNIYHQEYNEIFIDASHGYTEEEVRKGRYRPGEGITGTVIETGKPVVVPSVENEPRFLNRTGARQEAEGLSFICVPVKINGDTIGTISVDIAGEQGDLEQAVQVLAFMSVMTAHAVHNRLHMVKKERDFKEENSELRARLALARKNSSIVGETRAMRDIHEKILMVAETDSTVLITGESGTGKELVADAIHRNSSRKDSPHVKVNMAALPGTLIESELFGHEKGAFTGALARKPGRFERAGGGTVFLDEIGDLGPELQAHLLRVIQEKVVERLGGTEAVPLDVRIIAATNRNLEEKIDAGSFREDLYYRLNVFPIHVPPLRDRKADIMLLADHFLRKFSVKYGKGINRISSEVIDMVTIYHWPGNIRELENCIERAVIVCTENVLRGYHLPPSLQVSGPESSATGDLQELTDIFQKEIITDQLKMTRGNITRAAENLGTTKRILAYRVKQLGIDFSRFKSD